MTYANGAVAESGYDAASRLTALRNLKSDRSVISIFTYSYDATGNRIGVSEASGDLVSWSYDNTYQLTREQRTGANSYDITYTYDGVGNRLTKMASGVITTSSYDAANQLSTSQDNTGTTTFTYDANGNTTSEVKPNSDRTTYTWDAENHVTKVELPASVVNTITLDGDGKRRTIEDSAGLKKLIWDAENILAETNSGGTTTAAYTLAQEQYGSLISQRRSGATAYHHFDALGSTNKLTDASAATVAEYLYNAFGEQSVLSGSSANPFTWVGRQGYYRQPDAQDYWVRARIMKPATGRWISRDPIHGKNNNYFYATNSSIMVIDASGLYEQQYMSQPSGLGSFSSPSRPCPEHIKLESQRDFIATVLREYVYKIDVDTQGGCQHLREIEETGFTIAGIGYEKSGFTCDNARYIKRFYCSWRCVLIDMKIEKPPYTVFVQWTGEKNYCKKQKCFARKLTHVKYEFSIGKVSVKFFKIWISRNIGAGLSGWWMEGEYCVDQSF